MPDAVMATRAYSGPYDLHSVLDLISARPLERVSDFPSNLDLQELLAVPKIQAGTRLWLDACGRLACFAILDMDPDSAKLIFEIAAGWQEKNLENDVIDWAEHSIHQTTPAVPQPFLLEISSPSDNPARIALLERLGLKRQAGGAVHLERSLADPIADPQLPAGFIIRPLRGEPEAPDWVKLHRAAHGTQNMAVEYKLAMMRTPYYDPEMDLVVTAPNGSLAAYCVCFIDVKGNALTGHRYGYTDPIATHPDFQRRGLSRALILSGLALLKDRSMETACLGTDSQNVAMLCTAGSVGFRTTRNILFFTKPIHIGDAEKSSSV